MTKKGSSDPDRSTHNFQPVFAKKFYCFRKTLVLVFQDPFSQRILIISFLYRDTVLENYGATIKTFINEMHRATGYLDTVLHSLSLGMQPGEARQERRVNVHHFSGKRANNG
jgi:hypothetical protein